MKISDKIEQVITNDPNNQRTCYSFEYFPPKTDAGKLIYAYAIL